MIDVRPALQHVKKFVKRHNTFLALFLTATTALILMLAPFILNGPHPLGYDTGFYRRFLIESHVAFPNPPTPGLDHTIIVPRIFLDIIRLTGLPTDTLLYGSYMLLVLGALGAFCLWARQVAGKHAALIATTLIALSSVHYSAYWFMLYKNFFALIPFFLTLYFLERDKFLPALFLALVIPPSHQSTTIILLLVLGCMCIVRLLMRRNPLHTLFVLIPTAYFYLILHPHVAHKIAAPPVGVLVERGEFILLVLPLLILALVGLPTLIARMRTRATLVSLTLIAVLFPLFALPYHQRILMYLNMVIALTAACGLIYVHETVTRTQQAHGRTLLLSGFCLLLFIFLGTTVRTVAHFKPLVSPDFLHTVAANNPAIATHTILTTPRLAPWVFGFSNARVVAPGMFRDSYPPGIWQRYFSHTDPWFDTLLLSSYPQPLFLVGEERNAILLLPKESCIQQINPVLYAFTCTYERR